MSIDKIEALADAIGRLNQIHNPDSEAYKLRSPGLVLSFARPGKHNVDSEGRRVFDSFLSGYRAFLFDLKKKISGTSRAGLHQESNLENLLGSYRISSPSSLDHVVSFLRRALNDQTITKNTPLSYFAE